MNLSVVCLLYLNHCMSDICLARFFFSLYHAFICFASFRCECCLPSDGTGVFLVLCQYNSKRDTTTTLTLENSNRKKEKQVGVAFHFAHPFFASFLYGFLAIVSHEHTCFTVHMPCSPSFWLRVSAVNMRCYHSMPCHVSYVSMFVHACTSLVPQHFIRCRT